MPIERGQDWGHAGSLPADVPVATNDASAAAILHAASSTSSTDDTIYIGLSGGDLARTLGLRTPFEPRAATHLVPLDALHIELEDGSTHLAVAHVVLGHPMRDRNVVAIMNAAFIGQRNVAPRGHPGDGKADVLRSDLGPTDRWKAIRRMATGSHLPHPNIKLRQSKADLIEVPKPALVRIDGVPAGRSRSLRFEVLPDAFVSAV